MLYSAGIYDRLPIFTKLVYLVSRMASPPRFERGKAAPKTAVLPLHYGEVYYSILYIKSWLHATVIFYMEPAFITI